MLCTRGMWRIEANASRLKEILHWQAAILKSICTSTCVSSIENKPELPLQVNDLFQQSKVGAHRPGKSQIAIKGVIKETANSALMRACMQKQPDIDGFRTAVQLYMTKNKLRHGHMDFIKTAMKFITPYELEQNVEVYNLLLDVFPRNVFENRTILDAVWPKPHPQINLALDILTKMEWAGLMPNQETHDIVAEVFGRASFPLQKIQRMFFWFEEFKNINPYELPEEVYTDKLTICKEILKRFTSSSDDVKVFELSAGKDVDGVLEYDHFVIGSQTSQQRELLAMCDCEKPLFVEGPFHMWLNKAREDYFVLKTGKGDLCSGPGVAVDPDEEREGVVLAICLVSRPFMEALSSWIKHLQEMNPKLRNCNVVFNVSETCAFDHATAIAAS